MALSRNLKHLTILLTILFTVGCQHGLIATNIVEFSSIEFNNDISSSFQRKSKKYFVTNLELDGPTLFVNSLRFKKKNLYGGPRSRIRQIEVIGELQFEITIKQRKKSGVVSSTVQFPSNEVNPQAEISAQKQLIDELEFSLLEALVQEYLLSESSVS
jgi:hypothetical protein